MRLRLRSVLFLVAFAALATAIAITPMRRAYYLRVAAVHETRHQECMRQALKELEKAAAIRHETNYFVTGCPDWGQHWKKAEQLEQRGRELVESAAFHAQLKRQYEACW